MVIGLQFVRTAVSKSIPNKLAIGVNKAYISAHWLILPSPQKPFIESVPTLLQLLGTRDPLSFGLRSIRL
jgi:hypothetical protein